MFVTLTLVSCHFMTLIIKSTPVLSTSGKKMRRKLVTAISAESIYRCMLLFLDHILNYRAHFVRDVSVTSCAHYYHLNKPSASFNKSTPPPPTINTFSRNHSDQFSSFFFPEVGRTDWGGLDYTTIHKICVSLISFTK